MNNKTKTYVVPLVIFAAITCLSIVIVAANVLPGIAVVNVPTAQEPRAIPTESVGQVFDQYGNTLIYFPKDGGIFDADGNALFIMPDGDDNIRVITHEESMELMLSETLVFEDMDEGRSHFFSDNILMPGYLPEGYDFGHISFYVDSLETLQANPDTTKNMLIFFNNNRVPQDVLFMQISYVDEDNPVEIRAGEDAQNIQINGNDALLQTGQLDIMIDNILYTIYADNLDISELIKIGESLE